MAEYYVMGDAYRDREEAIDRAQSSHNSFEVMKMMNGTKAIVGKIEESGVKKAARRFNSMFGNYYSQGFTYISVFNPRNGKVSSYSVNMSSGSHNWKLKSVDRTINTVEELEDQIKNYYEDVT